MIKKNYHTHCSYCGHAKGDVEDYVKEAIDKGFEVLGMSDHIPYPENDWGDRMDYSFKDEYLGKVRECREKYKDKIDVKIAFEAEYVPKYRDYYEELKEKENLDYLILGQHFFFMDDGSLVNCFATVTDTEQYIRYAEACVEGMNTGIYAYLAHPDLIFRNRLAPDKNTEKAIDIILDAAVNNDYILEINANGFRRGIREFPEGKRYPYPVDTFWDRVKGTNLRAIIGSDCHDPSFLADEYVEIAERFALEKGLRLIDTI